MLKFDPDLDLDRDTPECALQDAHDYAKWQFQLAVRDLMENHGYTETELAAMVIDAMPLAEEMDVVLTIPESDRPF